jgi:hypothetical protein
MEMIGMHVNALRKLMRDIGCAEKLIGSNQSYIGLLDEAYLHLEEILEQNEFTKLTLNGYSDAPIKSLVLTSKEEAETGYLRWLDAHFMNHEGYSVSNNSGKRVAPRTPLSVDHADCNNLNNRGAPRNESDDDDCECNLSNRGSARSDSQIFDENDGDRDNQNRDTPKSS